MRGVVVRVGTRRVIGHVRDLCDFWYEISERGPHTVAQRRRHHAASLTRPAQLEIGDSALDPVEPSGAAVCGDRRIDVVIEHPPDPRCGVAVELGGRSDALGARAERVRRLDHQPAGGQIALTIKSCAAESLDAGARDRELDPAVGLDRVTFDSIAGGSEPQVVAELAERIDAGHLDPQRQIAGVVLAVAHQQDLLDSFVGDSQNRVHTRTVANAEAPSGSVASASVTKLGSNIVRRQVAIGGSIVSPDGEWVVYTRRTVAANRYQTNLWLVPYRGGRARQLTHGLWEDSSPVFAPDSRTIAFFSDRGPDEEDHLYVMRIDGGEAELVCGGRHESMSSPVFSPDGRSIAFIAAAGDPRFLAGNPKDEVAREIRAIDWRDDSGVLDYRYHLYVVAARPGARARELTRGDYDVSAAAWHPSGQKLVFVAATGPLPDVDPNASIHQVSVKGGRVRELVKLAGTASSPTWSPDGRTLAFVGVDTQYAPDYAEPELYVRTSGGELRSLTGKLDLPVTIAFCSDLHDWRVESSGGPIWENDESLVVVINRRGRDEVWRVTVDGDAAPLSEGDTTITGIAAGGGRVVTTACDDAYPPEVFAVEPDGLRKLTRNGGAWLRRYAAPRITEVDAGGIPSFVLEPANARGPGAMVLSPHGGPYGAHGPTPELDGWALVELGYRVLLPNIRGSCGYGREWIKPIQGKWGGPDADDLVTSLDWAIDAGIADPKRVAAMGLSYGGWAVNWLAGAAPERFCAIVSENGVASMSSAHGTSSIGPGYDRAIGYGPVITRQKELWRSSPLRLANAITAPVLMLQGEADRVCPLDDNQQLFVALRERGHDVEMVLYPGGKHVMMATMRPDRREHRLARVTKFLTKHCPPRSR